MGEAVTEEETEEEDLFWFIILNLKADSLALVILRLDSKPMVAFASVSIY